ncbi:LrgB family protein [Listeria ilorinensis]|uniref:LrgB family protein n=1 Tax=Listeria ilorinensis TaxID=2867439 RepID=UPI001EF4E925|nr:LrgB family protein [Listeria ilorinensis]
MMIWLVLTLALYGIAWLINRRFPTIFTLPVITASVAMMVLLLLLDVGYVDYARNSALLTYMLGPGIVAFAVPLYKVRSRVVKYLPLILLGVLLGAFVSLFTTWLFAHILPLSDEVKKALLPKNITLPIAMGVADRGAFSVPLTSVTVVLSGCFGFAFGQKILKQMGIEHPVAKGVAMAATSHIMGTSASMLVSEDEGAVALVTMALSAVLASFFYPFFAQLFFG